MKIRDIAFSESENGSWEVVNHKDKIELLRFEDDQIKDIILMDVEEFDDLVNFIKKFDS